MISTCKGEKEEHAADAMGNALFRIFLAIQFRRRGEPQIAI